MRNLVEVEPGLERNYRWLPLDESELQPTIFNVGQYVQFRAIYSGTLICFANDAQSLYWNNNGFLQVTVTRLTWPPSNDTYYKERELPACDSASVVYAMLQQINGLAKLDKPVLCNRNGGGSGWSRERSNVDLDKYYAMFEKSPVTPNQNSTVTPTDSPTFAPT